jgi:prepilin-type N-terminal cleavage/methylation domain-containing protein
MRAPLSRQGFTIVELMVVVAVIALVTAIAVPNFLTARVAANESAAVANLRTISSAQSQYQASANADVDLDGLGEFGTLAEMGGARGVRTDADGTAGGILETAVLSTSYGRLNVNGEATRAGYLYRVFLPAQGDTASTEMTEDGDLSARVDVDVSETKWCVYAWPEDASRTGSRAFFVNQRGKVTAAAEGYSGTAAIEPANAGAAFAAPNPLDSIGGNAAVAAVGADGGMWVLAR